MIYTADTHSIIWFLTKDRKLGYEALKAFRSADEGKSLVIIPSIVLAEIIYIIEFKGVNIQFSDITKKFEESMNYIIYNLNLEVLMEMEKYKKLKDIHDRIIVATANLCKSKLITNDTEINKSEYVETVW